MRIMNRLTRARRAGTRRWLRYATLALLCSAAAGMAAARESVAEEPANPALLDRLLDWLPGDYSNADFVLNGTAPAADRDPGAADDAILTTYIRRVRLPALGEHLVYLEEYRGADEAVLERVRLYVLEPGSDAGAVEMLVVNPRNPGALAGARDHLATVEALTAQDLRPDNAGCRLSFRAGVAGYITGRMAYRGCRFRDQWVDYELHLGPADHWVCYSRRQLASDAVTWQLVPGYPCIRMARR